MAHDEYVTRPSKESPTLQVRSGVKDCWVLMTKAAALECVEDLERRSREAFVQPGGSLMASQGDVSLPPLSKGVETYSDRIRATDDPLSSSEASSADMARAILADAADISSAIRVKISSDEPGEREYSTRSSPR